MSNSYKRFAFVFAGATTENLLAVPAATTAIVKSIIVANPTGSPIDVIALFTTPAAVSVSVAPSLAVASSDYTDLLTGKVAGPLILEAGDILKITSSAADLNVTVSALLVDRN